MPDFTSSEVFSKLLSGLPSLLSHRKPVMTTYIESISNTHEESCNIENGFANHTLMFNSTSMKTLSKAKNLTIPWYLLYLIDKNHENRIISIVPAIIIR